MEEAEEGSREEGEEGQGLGQVDSISTLLPVLYDRTSPHSEAELTNIVSQSRGIRNLAVLIWDILPEPLSRLGLLTTPRQDLHH